MAWTRFMDMHSGGGLKEPFAYCFIEAPEDEAVAVFYARFGHNPRRVSCTCCGDDYSIEEEPTLEQATAYNRRLRYAHSGDWHASTREERRAMEGRYFEPHEQIPEGWVVNQAISRGEPVTMEQFLADPHFDDFGRRSEVLIIPADEIAPSERTAEVPDQGYVWVD